MVRYLNPVWPNGWVFLYELSGSGFESSCSHLNPVNHHSARIAKTDKEFAKRLDFKDRKFPVKIRDIQKIKKKEFR